MKMNTFSLVTLFIILMISSCSRSNPTALKFKKVDSFAYSNKLQKGEAPLNYASLKKYILKPKCMSCHSGADAKPKDDPIDFSSYKVMTS